jgi:hypothetical protein
VDPQRGSYPTDPGVRWFGGDPQRPDPRYEHHTDPGGYYAQPPMGAPAPPDPRQYVGQPPAIESSRRSERAASAKGRPAVGAIIVVVAIAAALPVLRVLATSALGSAVSVSGVVASVLLLLALFLGAIGLHGLASGGAALRDVPPIQIWLRPPVAYCMVALVLCVAAGLAAA